MSQPSGRIVAELGRPETPEETAARQAASSKRYRDSKTFTNLVIALIVSVLLMVAMVWMVPRDDTPITRDVNVAEVASASQPQVDGALAVPAVPEGWTSNQASIRTGADGITEWYAGYIVPNEAGRPGEFAGFSQGFNANPTWVLEQVNRRTQTGTTQIGGHEWAVYDYTALPESETGNKAYTLVTEVDASILIVYGSATPEPVEQLAEAALASLDGTA